MQTVHVGTAAKMSWLCLLDNSVTNEELLTQVENLEQSVLTQDCGAVQANCEGEKLLILI